MSITENSSKVNINNDYQAMIAAGLRQEWNLKSFLPNADLSGPLERIKLSPVDSMWA